MTHILIIVASYAFGGDRSITATTAEFSSKSRCELAASKIIKDSLTKRLTYDGIPMYEFTYTCAMK